MPCVKCPNGKWRFGSSKCMYTSLKKCNAAAAAYYASHPGEKDGLQETKRKETKKEIDFWEEAKLHAFNNLQTLMRVILKAKKTGE